MGLSNQLVTREVKVKPKKEVPWTTDQLTNFFQSFDSNNDGQFSLIMDLKAAFEKLGSKFSVFRTVRGLDYVQDQPYIRHSRTAETLEYAEGDSNGFINRANAEFSSLVKQAYKALGHDRTAEARDYADDDSIGYIDLANADQLSDLVKYAHSCG